MLKDNPLKHAIKYKKLIARAMKANELTREGENLDKKAGGEIRVIRPKINRYATQFDNEEKITIKCILRG
ncbi:MAG TPA: hypothetical protein VKY27_01430 [Bacteriovoracaceae bacterium]|nr:hypothetical protein [Bacteriovoracaceae bacterium]